MEKCAKAIEKNCKRQTTFLCNAMNNDGCVKVTDRAMFAGHFSI